MSLWVLLSAATVAIAQPDDNRDSPGVGSSTGTKERNFVVAPIPISDPTLDTGLVLGGAYFYPQTPEQEKVQPTSVTFAAGMYTNNDSFAYGIGQQIYWDEDSWRFSGGIAFADLKLVLLIPDAAGVVQNAEWLLRGGFTQVQLSRKIEEHWYIGVVGRYVDGDQTINPDIPSPVFDIFTELKSVGFGLELEYDARDMPINSYNGSLFEAGASFNDQSSGNNESYQAYHLAYRSYHEMSASIVLAWEIEGCLKSSSVPLWDACRIGLRGFSATDHLGKSSGSGQIEARWRMSKRWGLVGFAGAGFIGQPFSRFREKELIPSYGIGLRFMILPAKRINVRLDYGFSTDSNAIHVSVGESF